MIVYEDVQEVVYDAAIKCVSYDEAFVNDVTRRVMNLIDAEEYDAPKSRFGEGYNDGLEDTREWLRNVTQEWYNLKIISAEQFLPIKDLLHEFDLRFMYAPTGEDSQ